MIYTGSSYQVSRTNRPKRCRKAMRTEERCTVAHDFMLIVVELLLLTTLVVQIEYSVRACVRVCKQ